MKPLLPALCLGMLAFVTAPEAAALVVGQEETAKPAAAKPDQAALEAEFARMLTGAKLVGSFTQDDLPEGAGLQEDAYQLGKVSKVEGKTWRFEATIQYGGRNMVVPLLLSVEWAGDTPVITLTDMPFPGLGVFTARVLFYRDQYAGYWGSSKHGGHLFGKVVRPEEEHGEEGGDEHGDKDHDEGAKGNGEKSGGDEGDTSGPAGGGGGGAGAEDDNWPSFRGHLARGVAEGHLTATEWNVPEDVNVKWKTPVAGLSHSSPIVWGNRIFLNTAVKLGEGEPELRVGQYGSIGSVEDEGPHRFQTIALDKKTGEVLWTETLHEGAPKFPRHPKSSFAASTPATDGVRLVSFFGTEGLHCQDLDGKLLWKKDLGDLDSAFFMVPDAKWGFSSSPVLHEGRVIVQCDVLGDSFLTALDAETGEEVWRTARKDVPTWSTPTVDVREGRSQVIVNGFNHIGGYDLATGTELWKVDGGGDIPVPTPIVSGDLIFITGAHGSRAPIYAIPAMVSGEIDRTVETSEKLAWSESRRGNYLQTPLAYGEEFYTCSGAGILACYDARTGKESYRERLGSGGSGFTASPVAADGKLYLTGEDGEVYVIAAGTTFEVLSVNDMGETCMATPAISEGVMYWRTRGHLVAIEE